MADFKPGVRIDGYNTRIVSAPLGTAPSEGYGDEDVGKAVKQVDPYAYAVCADGDEVEGFITSVESWTVNDLYAFGGVTQDNRFEAEVGSGTVAVGDLVVAAAQVAVGTAGLAKVKAGAPTQFMWRAINVSGTGAVGDKVILERQ